MIVQLDCPWCAGSVAADPDALDEPVRCEDCALTFEVAPDEEVAVAQAA
ncbi:MAG TPA: hypothetical protein VGQ47_01200 [Candidatus Limnocylindrales bacterium]|jgi:hypothetical protein|nr:hypothetical protein [Candidatus Limnocylindrales bacterium]